MSKLMMIAILMVLGLGQGLSTQIEEAYELPIEEAKSRQDWVSLAEMLTRQLEKTPDWHDLKGELAKAYLKQGDWERCEAWIEKWETHDSISAAGRLHLLGRLAWDREQPGLARDHWIASYFTHPTIDAARSLTHVRIWEGIDPVRHEAWMKRIAQHFPLVKALSVTAMATVRDRDWPRLRNMIRTLNGQATRDAMREAARFENVVKHVNAVNNADKAFKRLNEGAALANRARLWLYLQCTPLAEEDAKRAREVGPRRVLPQLALAACYHNRGDDEAVQALQVVTKEDLTNLGDDAWETLTLLDDRANAATVAPKTYLDRANLLERLKQPYLALKDLQSYRDAGEESAVALVCEGRCLQQTGAAHDARTAFEKALNADGEIVGAWRGLAELAMQRADYAEAIKRYRWLASHDPNKNNDHEERLAVCQSRIR